MRCENCYHSVAEMLRPKNDEIDRLRAEVASLKEEKERAIEGHRASTAANKELVLKNRDLTKKLADSEDTVNELRAAFEHIENKLLDVIDAAMEQNAMLTVRMQEAYSALKGLRNLATKLVCYHDETHRGGSIWEICDSCGAQWADDEGGKPEFKEPIEITRASAVLTAHHQQVKSEDAREERAKAERDAMLYGQGFMVGGKHVPLQDVLIVPPAISAQGTWAPDANDGMRFLEATDLARGKTDQT